MLYWIIPYLLAFDATEFEGWEYGPKYVFDAGVHDVKTDLIDDSTLTSDTRLKFTCRLMSSNLIRCCITSGTVYMVQPEYKVESLGVDGVIFQIEYDAKGISRVWFLNNNERLLPNIIRTIAETMNMGMNITGEQVEDYVSLEKSTIGTCNTSYVMMKILSSELESDFEKEIEDYDLHVPSLKTRRDNETIVIDKKRHMSECVKQTPYFFGCSDEADDPAGQKSQILITTSRSQFILGKKIFSAFTESSGRIVTASRNESGSTRNLHVRQLIHVRLESIETAREEVWNVTNLENPPAGYLELSVLFP